MSTENLEKKEAVDKIKELGAGIALFTTALTILPLTTRPMGTMNVDDEGNLWFFSKKDSNKNQEIRNDSRVQLFYANNSNAEYLSIYGVAEILSDRQKIEELWTPMAKAWFTEGKDDPSLSLIKVVPEDAYYWDAKHNKLVALIKIAAAAVTGKTMDDGVEGELAV